MLVITCLCKITSAEEEEGQDGKTAKAGRDGASVRRAGSGWERLYLVVPCHGPAGACLACQHRGQHHPKTPLSPSSLRCSKTQNYLQPTSKQPRGCSTYSGEWQLHVLLMGRRFQPWCSPCSANPPPLLSEVRLPGVPVSARGKGPSAQTRAAGTWL